MLTGDEVLNLTFTQTQFRRGYDEREVDDFLDEVVAALRHHESGAGPARLTADAVRARRFTQTQLRRGYEEQEVDEVLERVAATLAAHEGGTAPPRRTSAAGRAASPAPTGAPAPSLRARVLRVLRGDPR